MPYLHSVSASVDWILLSPTPTHISLVTSHKCVTHAPHYRGQINYRPSFTPLHIPLWVTSLVGLPVFLWCKHSPLPSCIPAAFGNTWNHSLTIFLQTPLVISSSVTEFPESGEETQLWWANLCVPPIFVSQNPCRSGHRATATTDF